MLVDGTEIPFDRLVLATGSIPTLPPIRGLVRMDGRLHPKVHAFRSRLPTATAAARRACPRQRQRAVVVGGGLLGLQVARALTVRGVATEVVEGTEHLLSRQVGAPRRRGSSARDLRRLGTEVYTGTRAVRLTDEGLRLDNGYMLDTDLVVLAAGGRPSTALARRAGLMVRPRRGGRRRPAVGHRRADPRDRRLRRAPRPDHRLRAAGVGAGRGARPTT